MVVDAAVLQRSAGVGLRSVAAELFQVGALNSNNVLFPSKMSLWPKSETNAICSKVQIFRRIHKVELHCYEFKDPRVYSSTDRETYFILETLNAESVNHRPDPGTPATMSFVASPLCIFEISLCRTVFLRCGPYEVFLS